MDLRLHSPNWKPYCPVPDVQRLGICISGGSQHKFRGIRVVATSVVPELSTASESRLKWRLWENQFSTSLIVTLRIKHSKRHIWIAPLYGHHLQYNRHFRQQEKSSQGTKNDTAATGQLKRKANNLLWSEFPDFLHKVWEQPSISHHNSLP